MFLKNKNIIFKIRRSKVTDYAALRTVFGLGPAASWSLLMSFIPCSASTWGNYYTSPIQINGKLWITATGWMATDSMLIFPHSKYVQPWYGISSHHVMLKAKQAWCLLAFWLFSIVNKVTKVFVKQILVVDHNLEYLEIEDSLDWPLLMDSCHQNL